MIDALNDRTTTLYDASGNVTVARNSAGAYTLTNDALNRVTVVKGLWGVTLTFLYDAGLTKWQPARRKSLPSKDERT